MKRYVVSILVAVLAISGIGTFYAFGRQNHQPAYKLETVEGNPAEGAVVNLSGSQYGDMRSEPLIVNINGSKYQGKNRTFRNSVMASASWLYNDPDIRKLVSDHKSFMRGKGNEYGLFRDEEFVIYANAATKNLSENDQTSVVSLSILREDTGQETRFQQTVLEPPDDGQLSVFDVQRIDNEVHILFTKYKGKGSTVEFVVCVFDLNNGELLRQSVLKSWSNGADGKDFYLSAIEPDRVIAPNDEVLVVANEILKNEGNKIGEKHYSYSYRSGSFTELPGLLRQTADESKMSQSLHHDYFYYAEYGPDLVSLSRYNLKSKEREDEYALISAGQLGAAEIKNVQIHSNRVYLLIVDPAGIPGAAVLDLANGKLLYKGRTVETGDDKQTAEEMKENLHLLNLDITDQHES